jgi:hypothetical protein
MMIVNNTHARENRFLEKLLRETTKFANRKAENPTKVQP